MEKITNYIKSKTPIIDLIALLTIGALSLFHISFYLDANYLNTLYPDWLVHAFRIKTLQEFGLVSRTHIWSNGIELWRAYQFLPHIITLGVINVFHLPVTKAMIFVTIALFFLLRFILYFSLRALGFSPIVAILGVLLSFNLAQYWAGVADFSLLFGFSLFPLILTLWITYTQGKIQSLFPFIIGLTFYFHPLLGIVSSALWFIGLFTIKRSLFSLENAKQAAIILLTSSLFWLPIVYKSSFLYTSQNIASKYFLRLLLSNYQYYGLSIAILGAIIIGTLQIFIPQITKPRWTKPLLFFVLGFMGFVIMGTAVDLPKALSQFQFTRGVTFIGLAAIFLVAPVLQWIISKKLILVNLAGTFIAALIIVDGIWFTSSHAPNLTKNFDEPANVLAKTKIGKDMQNSQIWTSDIGTSSFFNDTSIYFPYSYMSHLDPNYISPRINQLINYQAYVGDIPQENIERINNYYKASGVKYAIFEENSPFTKTFSESANPEYKNLGRLNLPKTIYHVFKVPWEIKKAALIAPENTPTLKTFPNKLRLEDSKDQILLDNYVEQFTKTVYKPENKTLKVEYPSQESLKIAIPEKRTTQYVYINESYSSQWQAKFNGEKITLQSVGPNYILATLPDRTTGGTLTLNHSWPITFYISWALIIGIPITILFANLTKLAYAKYYTRKTNHAVEKLMRPIF